MCDLTKITKTTNRIYNQLVKALAGTDDEYHYMIGVNGIDEVCFTDFRTGREVKGNRAAQKEMKAIIANLS